MNWNETLFDLGVREPALSKWAKVFAENLTPEKFSAGADEIPAFLGQILHESAMLTRIEENLNYSHAERLCAVWPSRFPTVAIAEPFTHNPRALANKVYGGRMGNVGADDGYKYRGRGLLQVTGRANYIAVGKAIGIDLEQHPDELAEPVTALMASIAWWEGNIPDSAIGDIKRITKLVNGGLNGFADRVALTNEARDDLT